MTPDWEYVQSRSLAAAFPFFNATIQNAASPQQHQSNRTGHSISSRLQLRVELTLAVQSMDVIAAANVLVTDEDLGDRRRALRPLYEIGHLSFGEAVPVDFLKRDPLGLQQRLGLRRGVKRGWGWGWVNVLKGLRGLESSRLTFVQEGHQLAEYTLTCLKAPVAEDAILLNARRLDINE